MLKDHLGSANVITDGSGATVGEARYYPYGETRLTTGSMYTDQLFTGQREMAGLGIYHYGARFYSPKLGRFLSADSIVPNAANPQDFNRYSYVRNNPMRYTDPSGHVCTDPEDPTPTCYGSGTTRVGNRMIQGNQAELGAAKNLLKVVKKTKGEGGGGGTLPPLVQPDGGIPQSDAPVIITNPDPLEPGLEQADPTPTSETEQTCWGCDPRFLTGILALFEGLVFATASIAAYALVIGATGPIGLVLGAPFLFTAIVGLDWAAFGAQEIVYSGSDKEADPIILVHLVFPDFGK